MKYRFLIIALFISFLGIPSLNKGIAQTDAPSDMAVPTYIVASNWPNIPADLRIGTVSSVAVDEQDNVWILHRPKTVPMDQSELAAPPLIVFDSDGNFVKAWGGPGSEYEWPQNEHGLHIDNKGFVWVTGNSCSNLDESLGSNSDDQILKFTQEGEFILQIGRAGQNSGNVDRLNVNRSADLSVFPQTSELFVADGYGNRRVIVFDSDTGAFKRQWGAFGESPGTRSPCASLEDIEWDSDQFSIVHSIRVSNDGIVYVADREHSRIQIFTLEGEFIEEFNGQGGRTGSLSFSPDERQQYLYVGEMDRGILILNRQTLSLVTTLNAEGINGPNHHMAVDSNGNIYRTGLAGGISKFEFSGMSQ